MRTMWTATAWAGAIAIGVFAAACSDSAERRSRDAADSAATATERAGDEARDAARDTADKVEQAGRNVAGAASAAAETMDVKTALIADDRVDAGDIDVDTSGDTKTVVLKGSVPTVEQKTIAGQIAMAEADGYRIQNDLVVRPSGGR